MLCVTASSHVERRATLEETGTRTLTCFLRSNGFVPWDVEVQELYFRLTGTLPKPTCKHRTKRDFLFISEELVPLFRSCHVDPDVWVDHSTVCAHFEGGIPEMQVRSWPRPLPLDWKHAPDERVATPLDFAAPGDPTAQYREVWRQVESQVPSVVPARNSMGRGQCFAPVLAPAAAPHVPVGRRGDDPPPALSQSWIHFHRFRQCRRLKFLVRLLAAAPSTSRFQPWFVGFDSPWSGLQAILP